MIRKSFQAVETKVLDPSQGLVECVFSVTGNVDRQNDLIEPGAFSKALAAKSSVPVVYAHSWNDINQVLGKTVSWTELFPGDPGLPEALQTKGYGGVKARVQFDQETPAGRVAFTHVKNKNIKDWSWAFDIAPDGEKSEDDFIRHIRPGGVQEIYEVTLALVGANPAATTMAFKAMVEAEAAVEPAITTDYDEALADLFEVAAQAVDTAEAKSRDEAISRAAEARLLSELSTLTPTVPVNDKAPRDDEPDFDHFLTHPFQGVVPRG